MSAAKILADDGIYKLAFVKRDKCYRAGCRYFTCEEAVRHWKARKEGVCPCGCARKDPWSTAGSRKRARLFLKAIKKHAAEQSQ